MLHHSLKKPQILLILFWVSLLGACMLDSQKSGEARIRVSYQIEVNKDSLSNLDSIRFDVYATPSLDTIYSGVCEKKLILSLNNNWVCQFEFETDQDQEIHIAYIAFDGVMPVMWGNNDLDLSKMESGSYPGVVSWEEIQKDVSSSFNGSSSKPQSSSTPTVLSSSLKPQSSSTPTVLSSSSKPQSSSTPTVLSSSSKPQSSSTPTTLSSSSKPLSSSAIVSSSSLTLVTVSITGDGTGTFSGEGPYVKGATVNLNATPEGGLTFYRWGGADSALVVNRSSASTTVIASKNLQLIARFKKQWTVKIGATAGGTINPSAGTYTYWDGELMSLTFSPSAGYAVVGMRGTQNGNTSPQNWYVTQNDSVYVNFGIIEWSQVSQPTSFGSGAGLVMLDDNTGYAIDGKLGVARLDKTTDGGLNWSTVTPPPAPTSGAVMLRAIYREPGTQNLYISGGNDVNGKCIPTIWKSTDAGSSWSNLDTIAGMGCLERVAFKGALGYVGGVNGLYKTTDGGSNWTKIISNRVHTLTLRADGAMYASGWSTGAPSYFYLWYMPSGSTVLTNILETITSERHESFFYHEYLDANVATRGGTTAAFWLDVTGMNAPSTWGSWTSTVYGYWKCYFMQQKYITTEVLMAGYDGSQSVYFATFAPDKRSISSWRVSAMPSAVLPRALAELSTGAFLIQGSDGKIYRRPPM